MSRSDHHGCKPRCGVCQPQKRWKHQLARAARLKASDRRRMGDRRESSSWGLPPR